MTANDEKYIYSPVVRDFLNEIKNDPPLSSDTFESSRARVLKIQSFQSFKEDVQRNDYDILLKTGEKVHVRVVRNKTLKGLLPVAFFVHGGSFVWGDAMCYDSFLYRLAKNVPAAFVFVEYSLAPNVRYPKPLNELFSVFIHLLKNYRNFQLNPKKIIMMGDGVGANLATVLTYYAINKGYQIDSEMLFYPVLNGVMNFDSYTTNQNAFWIDSQTANWFWDAYEPDINNRKNPYVSPYYITKEELKKMPFSFILTVQNDIFADDGFLYAQKLRGAGVDVLHMTISGVVHDFLMLQPLSNAPETKMSFDLISSILNERI